MPMAPPVPTGAAVAPAKPGDFKQYAGPAPPRGMPAPAEPQLAAKAQNAARGDMANRLQDDKADERAALNARAAMLSRG